MLPQTQLKPEDLMTADDPWEYDPGDRIPRETIITMLTVRKGPGGFICLLVVEMGSDSVKQSPHAFGTIGQITDWLRKYELAADVAKALGTDEQPYAFIRRWKEKFTGPLEQFQLRITEPERFLSEEENARRRRLCPPT